MESPQEYKPCDPDKVTAFARCRLPSGFVLPQEMDEDDEEDGGPSLSEKLHSEYVDPLEEIEGFRYLKLGRLVEDPDEALLMRYMYAFDLICLSDLILTLKTDILSDALSPESLSTVLASQELKACFTLLDIEQMPRHFTVPGFPLGGLFRQTIATLTFPYTTTPERRSNVLDVGPIRYPARFCQGRPFLGSRVGGRVWVQEPQFLLDGRQVKLALVTQAWRHEEREDVSATEDVEARNHWMESIKERLGALDVKLDRWNVYYL